jgi:restriction endonuclease
MGFNDLRYLFHGSPDLFDVAIFPQRIKWRDFARILPRSLHAQQVQETASVYESKSFELPDLITYLQNETNLTRRTIVKIINDSGRLESFKNNPQKFIEQVSTIIQHQMRLFVVDGIKYHKIGDDQFMRRSFSVITSCLVIYKKTW